MAATPRLETLEPRALLSFQGMSTFPLEIPRAPEIEVSRAAAGPIVLTALSTTKPPETYSISTVEISSAKAHAPSPYAEGLSGVLAVISERAVPSADSITGTAAFVPVPRLGSGAEQAGSVSTFQYDLSRPGSLAGDSILHAESAPGPSLVDLSLAPYPQSSGDGMDTGGNFVKVRFPLRFLLMVETASDVSTWRSTADFTTVDATLGSAPPAAMPFVTVVRAEESTSSDRSPFEDLDSLTVAREARARGDWSFNVSIAGGWGLDSLALAMGLSTDAGGVAISDDRNLPELDALAFSTLESLLGRSAALSLPQPGNFEEVEELVPLGDSPLALTVTLLTIPGRSTPAPLEPAAPSTAVAACESPPWAGFVTGLDDALETTRRATRAQALADAATFGAGSAGAPGEGVAAVDETLRLDPEGPRAYPIAEPPIPVPSLDPEVSPEESERAAAVAASVCLVTVPILTAGPIAPPRFRRRKRRNRKEKG
jgi:hypothetical protein